MTNTPIFIKTKKYTHYIVFKIFFYLKSDFLINHKICQLIIGSLIYGISLYLGIFFI